MIKQIKEKLDEKVKKRDEALTVQREIIPLCAQAIRDIQKKKGAEAEKKLKTVEAKIKQVEKILKDHPDLEKSVLGASYQEYAELRILFEYMKTGKLAEIDVPPEAYLTGLGDAIGELKRIGMDYLAENKLKEAEKLYDALEDMYYEFSQYVYPNSIVPGLKAKQDAMRRVLNSFQENIQLAKIRKNG